MLAGDESIPVDDKSVMISAKNKTGFDELLKCISRNLPETSVRKKLLIPYDKTNLISIIRNEGKIFSENYTETGTEIDALVDIKQLYLVDEYSID